MLWDNTDALKLREVIVKLETELRTTYPEIPKNATLEQAAMAAARIEGYQLAIAAINQLSQNQTDKLPPPGFLDLSTM